MGGGFAVVRLDEARLELDGGLRVGERGARQLHLQVREGAVAQQRRRLVRLDGLGVQVDGAVELLRLEGGIALLLEAVGLLHGHGRVNLCGRENRGGSPR